MSVATLRIEADHISPSRSIAALARAAGARSQCPVGGQEAGVMQSGEDRAHRVEAEQPRWRERP